MENLYQVKKGICPFETSCLEKFLDTKEETISKTLTNFREQGFLKSNRIYHEDGSNKTTQESCQLICKPLSKMALTYR